MIINSPIKLRINARSMNVLVLNLVAPKRETPISSGNGEAIINPAIPGINHLNLLFFILCIFVLFIMFSISSGSVFLKK